MSIDNSKKSPRLLQSRRYTHETFTDAQEAFTSVLDINSDEVYIDQNLIPSSSIPYGTSGDNLSVYSSGSQQVMKYYYRYKMTKSSTNTEVWFFTTGTTAGIDAQLIDSNQQVNFISPKYSIPSLSTANAEDATPGYGVKVFVSTNASAPSAGDQIASTKFVFDYKTGVLQFVLTADAPTVSQYVYISAYQYVGRKLSNSLTTYATTGSNRFNGSQTVTGSINVTSNITGSNISGSFIGDGAGLYNIPSTGITGLSLFQIASGSATASISPNNGLRINTKTEITGSLLIGSGSLDSTSAEILHVENSGSYNIAHFDGNHTGYTQINLQNHNSGSSASGDIVITADNGTETIHYVDLGINSSTYTAGYVGNANDAYLINAGKDLYIGTIGGISHPSNLNLFAKNNWQTPQIQISGSKQISFNTGSVSNGFQYEFSGSAKFDHNVNVVGDVTVNGTITAKEIHSAIVTSSVLYESGSTKFGDSLDDTHSFTGSVLIDNLLRVNRIAPLSGSNVSVESSNLLVPNGGIFSSYNIYASGSISASAFSGSAAGLINVPFQISGSDLSGNTYNKQFTKLQFDDSTGLNVEETVPGTAFISIGSHFKDIFVSGSPILSATGSDAFEIIGAGGLGISTSITDTNGNGYVKELTISATSLSSSLNNRMDTITGSITTLSSSLDSRINSLNTFTSSVVLTSQTSSMNVLSASYALTAAFALNAGAGGGNNSVTDGAYAVLNQTTPSTTWTFKHSLGQRYPIFQVFDSNGVVILPSQITTIDVDNATITFPSNQTGKVIASLGTGPGGLSQYFSSSTIWSLAHNLGSDYPIVTIWDSNRNIIFPQRIESVDTNNIKIYFSAPVAGYVNVAKGGHIISGSVSASNIDFTGTNIVSGSGQILITGTTGYSTFSGSISSSIGSLSSSVATTTLGLSSSIVSLSSSVATTTSGLSSSIGSLSSSVATTTLELSSSILSLSSSVATTTNTLSSSLSSSIGSLSSSVATTTLGLSSSILSLSSSVALTTSGLTSTITTLSSSLSSSIDYLSSSVASINNTQNGRLDSLETASGSIRTNFNTFTSSYNTGSFTGSFKGDGGQLYNIPSSGITGLNLSMIASGSATASISPNNGLRINTKTEITGSLIVSSGSAYVDNIIFNSSSVATLQNYMLQANTTDKTLDLRMGNNATLQLGQEIYFPPVVNKSGTDLNDGDLVMVNPAGIAQGNRISVVKAVADGTYVADKIIGVLTEDIANNAEGFATWFGYVRNISKTHVQPAGETWVEGDVLYANPTIAGKLTKVFPTAPNLRVTVATVTAINGNNVTILVNFHKRTALKRAHDVLDNTTTSSYGDILVKSGSVWTNSKNLNGNYNITGSLTITQNLTVLGSSSLLYVTSSQLAVSASTISVNIFEPAERFGGIKVYDSGSSAATASLLWDSLYNRWIYQNVDGASYHGAILIAGPRNTGSLGDELTLTSGRIVKSIGGDHIDNSIMSETGTTITVDGNLSATSLTGSINFSNLTNVPTLVSGSSQIDVTSTTNYTTFSSSISTSIGSLSSSVATTTVNLKNRIDSIEGITGSISSLNSFTSSINTTIKSKLDADGVISGSSQIIYSGLTGIPSGIVSGSEQLTGSYDTRYVLSGSITQTTWDNIASKPSGLISGSVQVELTGTTGYSTFSSSISTSIGSLSSSIASTTLGTKNRVDSIEAKTGSYATTGSNTFIGNENITGNLTVTGSIIVSSGSAVYNSSLNLTDTSSLTLNSGSSLYVYDTGIISGTFKGNVSGSLGINGNVAITGSVVASGTSLVSGSSQITYSGLTGIPSGIVSGSSQLTGSYDTRYVLSGSITQTTWDNIANKPLGIVSGSSQIINLGFATTSSTDLSGDRYLYSNSSSSGSWVITHNLGYQYPNVDVYDSSNQILIPQAITAVSTTTMQIDFATPTAGKAILTIGGAKSTGLFVQTGSYYNATTNIGITGSLVVTGDVDAANFNTTSDRKLKTNLVRIENALDKIEKLNGYTFDWLEEYSEDRTRQIGMVADEVYEVQPELISHRNIVLSNKEEKIKLLDYSKVTAILIEAIKELNDKVTKLENKKKKK